MNNFSLAQQAVFNIQNHLRTLSFFDEFKSIPPIAIDGIYGRETTNAVTVYQKIKGFPQTGKTDKQTFNSLYKDYTNVLNFKKSLTPTFDFPSYPQRFEFEIGYKGFYAYLLKHLLNELRTKRDTYPEFELNDIYDVDLSKAVSAIQKTYMIPETGKVDSVTWFNIISEYNKNRNSLLE